MTEIDSWKTAPLSSVLAVSFEVTKSSRAELDLFVGGAVSFVSISGSSFSLDLSDPFCLIKWVAVGELSGMTSFFILVVGTHVLGLESLSRTIFLTFLGVVLTSFSDLPGSLTWFVSISSLIVLSRTCNR